MLERRKKERIGITLSVELTGLDGDSKSKNTAIKGEINDLNQDGARVVFPHNPEAGRLLPGKIKIHIPPCYSMDPDSALPEEMVVQVRWEKPVRNRDETEYGISFIGLDDKRKHLLKNIVESEQERKEYEKTKKNPGRPEFEIRRELHSCNSYAIDLTIGCEHNCVYCHFSQNNQQKYFKDDPSIEKFPIPVDMSPLYSIKKFPRTTIMLSPSSDAFAPSARESAHELLSYLLPMGVKFTISTKNIIPGKTVDLLAKYPDLIEGIGVGVANLDEKRNRIVEPGCPSVEERLAGVKDLLKIGCSIGVRMDPIFPLLDDNEQSLKATVQAVFDSGIRKVSAAYLFSFGSTLRKMRRNPYLKESIRCMTEKSYVMGGKALSAPMETKKEKYNRLYEICRSNGIKFSICGCKETRLQSEKFSLTCRNMDFYNTKKQSSGGTSGFFATDY